MKTMLDRVFGWKALSAAALAVATSMTAYAPPATAGDGGVWAIGGLLAGHLLTDLSSEKRQQTQALNTMAYGNAQGRPATVVAVPAPSPTLTIEQKLNELNKLAAGGYITPEEYKAKKQAILNSL